MKKIMLYAMLMASAVILVSCSSEDPFEEMMNNNGWNNGDNTSRTGHQMDVFYHDIPMCDSLDSILPYFDNIVA